MSLRAVRATPNSGDANATTTNSRATAAKSSANFIQQWAQRAPLSDAQHANVAQAARVLKTNAHVPAHIVQLEKEREEAERKISGEQEDSGGGAKNSLAQLPSDIENVQEFYSWFAELQDEFDNEGEESYHKYLARLDFYRSCCVALLSLIDEALAHVQGVQRQYEQVSHTTNELHASCESLVRDQKRLVTFADALSEKLAYFTQMPAVSRRLSSPTLSVHDEDFSSLLASLDKAVSFLQAHRHFHDAETYLVKFQHLQSRALTMVKNYILRQMRAATAQILQTLHSGHSLEGITSDSSLLYLRFRSLATRVRPFCVELEQRRQRDSQYGGMLLDVQSCLVQQRRRLLVPHVERHLDALAEHNQLGSFVQSGAIYVVQLARAEHALYTRFFDSREEFVAKTHNFFLSSLAAAFYDRVRPPMLRFHSIEALCSLVSILKNDILEQEVFASRSQPVPSGGGTSGSVANSAAAINAASVELAVRSYVAPTLQRLLGDMQERLSFLSERFVREEVQQFVPSSSDLEYPDRLNSLRDKHANNTGVAPLVVETADSLDPATQLANANRDELFSYRAVYRAWYPTVEKTLLCLSKLYLALDRKVFESIAQDAVSACTQSVVAAAREIVKTKGAMDGTLFLIKNLLLLRDQLTPFDIDFRLTETQLDFSSMRQAFSRFFQRRSSIFSFSRNNALLTVVSDATPRVRYTHLDSKKDLEREIIKAIESFIMTAAKLVIDPLMSFLTKVRAYQSSASRHASTNDGPVSISRVRDQQFASPENMTKIMDEVVRNIETVLPDIVAKVVLYLPEPSSLNIRTSLQQNMISYTEELFVLVEKEYTQKEREVLGLGSLAELSHRVSSVTITMQNSERASSQAANATLTTAPPPSQTSKTKEGDRPTANGVGPKQSGE